MQKEKYTIRNRGCGRLCSLSRKADCADCSKNAYGGGGGGI